MKESTWVKIFLGLYLPTTIYLNIWGGIESHPRIVLMITLLALVMLLLSMVDEWDLTNK